MVKRKTPSKTKRHVMHTMSYGGASNLAKTMVSKFGWKVANKKATYVASKGMYAIEFDLTKEQYAEFLE